MKQVKAITFDLATVFDWMTALKIPLQAVFDRPGASIDTEAFAKAWRRDFLHLYERVVSGDRDWMTADEMFSEALHTLLAGYPKLQVNDTDRAQLLTAWQRMPAWPGVPKALARIRARYLIAPLTILSWPMVVHSSRCSGINWDGILSCDLLGIYKPHPACFAKGAKILQLEPHEIMMVASHPSELRAARSCGYRTAYVVPRLRDPGEDYDDPGLPREFDIFARDLSDLADQLGVS